MISLEPGAMAEIRTEQLPAAHLSLHLSPICSGCFASSESPAVLRSSGYNSLLSSGLAPHWGDHDSGNPQRVVEGHKYRDS